MRYSFSLLFFILLIFYAFIVQSDTPSLRIEIVSAEQTTNKEKAFTVLRDKCNVCHASKKRTDIFTRENMDSLATDINKQVFIKKKMPKGRKIKLTEYERSQLISWLENTLMEK